MRPKKASAQKEKVGKNSPNLSTSKKKSSEKNLQKGEQYQQPRSSSKEQKKNSKKNSKSKKQKQQMMADFLPGQRYQTPGEDDGACAFYKSLYESNPHSEIARKYCLEHGVLQLEQATMLLRQMNKTSSKKK